MVPVFKILTADVGNRKACIYQSAFNISFAIEASLEFVPRTTDKMNTYTYQWASYVFQKCY